MAMSSPTGGVSSFSLQGRLYRERERLSGCGMTDEERQERRQWLKDQRLSTDEPMAVKGLYEAKHNIFKRISRAPLDALVPILKPILGTENAIITRHVIGKSLIGLSLVYLATYYFKYNTNDWTRKGGWRIVKNRRNYFPGETFHTKVGDYSQGELTKPTAESEDITSANEKVTTASSSQIAYDLDLVIENDKIHKQLQKEELKLIKTLPRTLGSYYATRGFDKSDI